MWDCLMNMLTMIIFALAYSSSSIQLIDIIIIIKYILKGNKLAVPVQQDNDNGDRGSTNT